MLNALAAFTVGFVLDIAPEQIVEALSRYVPSGMRQKIVNSHGIIFIEDCYNASPDSMKASIGVLSSVSCTGKRIAVLADMLELGEDCEEAHERVTKTEWRVKSGKTLRPVTAYYLKGAAVCG